MFGLFKTQRELEAAKRVLERDKRQLTQFEREQMIISQSRTIAGLMFALAAAILVGLWHYIDPPKLYHERPKFKNYVEPVQKDTTYRLEQ